MRKLQAMWLIGALAVGIASAQDAPKKEHLFAFFANGGLVTTIPLIASRNVQTEFRFTNPGWSSARITVSFFSKDGLSDPPFSFNLPARSSVMHVFGPFGFSPLGGPKIGWARVESTEAIAVIENITLVLVEGGPGIPAPGVLSLTTVAIPPATPTRGFVARIEEGPWGSGLSIAVTGTGSSTGTLTLVDADGRTVASRQVTVAPNSQLVKTASELFPEVGRIFRGTVVGEFSGEVIVTSLRFSKGSPFIYSLNLVSSRSVP